jgi:hypothetical protein
LPHHQRNVPGDMLYMHRTPNRFTNGVSHSRPYGSTHTRTHGDADRCTNAQPNHVDDNNGDNDHETLDL